MKNLTPAKMVMFVFVAIGLLITFYLVKTLTAKEPPRQRVTTRNVPLSLTDLEPGTVISEGHVGMGPAPSNEVVGDVLLQVNGLIGRVVKNRISVTNLIHGSDLYPAGQLPPLKVVDGFTAVSLAQPDTSSMVNGLIRPGDKVDIFYSPNDLRGDPRYEKIRGTSIKLFRGVRVIAINRSFVQGDLETRQNSVTIEIRNTDAALLQLAVNTGKLTLSYTRVGSGESTVTVANPDRPTLEELLQLPPVEEEPEEPKEPEPNRHVTRRWGRGSFRTQAFVNGYPVSGGSVDRTGMNPSGGAAQAYQNPFGFPGTAAPAPGAFPGGLPAGQPGGGIWGPQPGSVPLSPPPSQELPQSGTGF